MRIISGALSGRSIKTVELDGVGYRPAMSRVRAAIFSMLGSLGVVWHEAKVLDLFAGSGSLAFEALSRGAPYACFVEMNKKATKCILNNANRFNLEPERYNIMDLDVNRFLRRRAETAFDVIFIDAPYQVPTIAPMVRSIAKGDYLADDGFLVAEVEARAPLPKIEDKLELHINRSYGQTRILIWSKQEISATLEQASE